MARNGIWRVLSHVVRRLVAPTRRRPTPRRPSSRRPGGAGVQTALGSAGVERTVEVRPESAGVVRLAYRPDSNGAPDAGEVVWTWVPYAENDGRGKDRPVLVIARLDAQRVYALKLTSRAQDDGHEHVSIGTGSWDSQGRESWVDLDQFYVVHHDGMRREAGALDLDRFTRVAHELRRRYGWRPA